MIFILFWYPSICLCQSTKNPIYWQLHHTSVCVTWSCDCCKCSITKRMKGNQSVPVVPWHTLVPVQLPICRYDLIFLGFQMYHFKMRLKLCHLSGACLSLSLSLLSSFLSSLSCVIYVFVCPLLLFSLGLPAGMLGSVADSALGKAAFWARTRDEVVSVKEVPF